MNHFVNFICFLKGTNHWRIPEIQSHERKTLKMWYGEINGLLLLIHSEQCLFTLNPKTSKTSRVRDFVTWAASEPTTDIWRDDTLMTADVNVMLHVLFNGNFNSSWSLRRFEYSWYRSYWLDMKGRVVNHSHCVCLHSDCSRRNCVFWSVHHIYMPPPPLYL